MDRLQAISFLKALYDQIPEISPQTVDLVQSTTINPENYRIVLKGLCNNCKIKAITFVNKEGLAYEEHENEFTIS